MVKQYVVGFAFNNNDVLLIEKKKPAWQSGLLNGVGGLVESGESIRDAMYREFKEETSLLTDCHNWVYRVCLKAFGGGESGCSDCLVNFFSIHLGSKERSKVGTITDDWADTSHLEKLVWVRVQNLYRRRVIPNLLWLIPLCLDKCLDPQQVIVVQDRKP